MQKWEYRVAVIKYDYIRDENGIKRGQMWGCEYGHQFTQLDIYLSNMGETGWELSSSVISQQVANGSPEHFLYFKRPLENSTTSN